MSIPPKNPVPPVAAPPGDVAANSDSGDVAPEARLHPILTNEEVYAARARAKKRVEDERRKAAMAAVEAEAAADIRREEGMITDSPADEVVTITIDLPEFSPGIVVNGRPYWHGHTYPVPRHVADSLREIMARANRHQELEIEGRKLGEFYRRPHHTTIGRAGVQNAPSVH